AVARAVEPAKPAARAERPSPKVAEAAPRPSDAAPKAADGAAKAAGAASRAADATKAGPAKAASGANAHWGQVGAVREPGTAKRIAGRLREQGLRVEESPTTVGAAAPRPSAPPPAADRYDVLVSGASAADVEAKLAPKGLKGESTAGGVVVR